MRHLRENGTAPSRDRRGVVIVAVLVVVVLLSLAAYQYSDLMLAEYRAADNAHRNAQARAIADSGVHYAAALLASPENVSGLLNDNPWHNPDKFRDVPVPGDENLPGQFTLIAPLDPDEGDDGEGCRYGVTDEGGKLNLNALLKLDPSGQKAYDALVKLPNMTEEAAASILDWLDADGEPRQGGAENDYYSGQSPPYRSKNGPLDSLEELLLVKGVTKELLFGSDQNRNGILDPDEEDLNGAGRGWSAYLTIYSREQNRDAAGNAYVFLNGRDLSDLYTKLSPEIGDDLAKFIVLYRQYGPSNSSGRSLGLGSTLSTLLCGGSGKSSKSSNNNRTVAGNLSNYTPDLNRRARSKLSSLFDLVNAQVAVPGKSRRDPTVIYSSPLNDANQQRELLPKLFEKATLVEETEIPARVNVNTAPREVLLALPELNESDVQNIVSQRPRQGALEPPGAIYQSPAWLLTEANVSLATLRKLDRFVTTRTQVYRVQSVGYFDGRGPAARVEAVIDVNGGRPRILAWRDLSELGKGWATNP